MSNNKSKGPSSDCLLEIHARQSARAVAAIICSAFKANVIHYSVVSHWYQPFSSGDISFEDELKWNQL